MFYLPLRSRIRIGLRGTFLRKALMAYRHRGVTEKDVILAGYPKCGTTWLMFMMVEAMWKPGKDHSLRDHRYSPNIGSQRLAKVTLSSWGRLIRSHEQYRPEYQRAIFIVRDPRDAATSMYWHAQRTVGMQATFSDFLPVYYQGVLNGAGGWLQHTNSWLGSSLVDKGQATIVRYEDMKADPAKELRRSLEFVGYSASDDDIARGVEGGRIDVMREREKTSKMIHRESTNVVLPAIRKGIVGDWRNHFSDSDLKNFLTLFGPTMERLGYATDGAVSQVV